MSETRTELTAEQVSIILQIINKGAYAGEQVEIITQLKHTLTKMLNEMQGK